MESRSSSAIIYQPSVGCHLGSLSQTLEDMLRACVVSFGNIWEKCLPLAEFTYNNYFQATLGKTPFEALYNQSSSVPLHCSEVSERRYFGHDSIDEIEEQVCIYRERLKAAQSRQKSYLDHQQDICFEVGDQVYL